MLFHYTDFHTAGCSNIARPYTDILLPINVISQTTLLQYIGFHTAGCCNMHRPYTDILLPIALTDRLCYFNKLISILLVAVTCTDLTLTSYCRLFWQTDHVTSVNWFPYCWLCNMHRPYTDILLPQTTLFCNNDFPTAGRSDIDRPPYSSVMIFPFAGWSDRQNTLLVYLDFPSAGCADIRQTTLILCTDFPFAGCSDIERPHYSFVLFFLLLVILT